MDDSLLPETQDHDTCTVEMLLNGLLSLCLPDEHKYNPPADFLGRYINAILPNLQISRLPDPNESEAES